MNLIKHIDKILIVLIMIGLVYYNNILKKEQIEKEKQLEEKVVINDPI
jgi:hypothetical protein